MSADPVAPEILAALVVIGVLQDAGRIGGGAFDVRLEPVAVRLGEHVRDGFVMDPQQVADLAWEFMLGAGEGVAAEHRVAVSRMVGAEATRLAGALERAQRR